MQGNFVWYELMTSDPQAAKAFYTKLVGWKAQDMPMPGMTYTMLNAGEVPAAGLFAITDEMKQMGVVPAWMGYVGVDDVDKAAAKVKSLGGAIHREPTDIPNMGRFAIAADPQGAAIAMFQGTGSGDAPPPQQGEPGRTGWHELYTTDWQKALDFYSTMFGWKKGQAMDMGPEMGTYQIFDFDGKMLGGMMNKPPNVPVPVWIYYVNVDDIDAAAKRVTDGGGQILLGPMEVPGGMWVLQGLDPQKAVFALIGPKK